MAHYPCRFHVTSSPNHEIEENEDIDDAFKLKKALTCYVLGYGGGLVSGDRINLDIYVKPKASLVLTSQSTSKAFKAIPGRRSTFVETKAKVSRGGLLFLVPQPLQCFGGSCFEQETHVVLEQLAECPTSDGIQEELDPSLLLVDWYTGGRRDQDGLWNFTTFRSTTTLSYSSDKFLEPNNGTSDLVFRDATRLSGGESLMRHMQNFNVVCMVILIGPRVKAVAQRFIEKYSSRHSYDENAPAVERIKFVSNDTSSLDHNRGEGLNKNRDGLLVSCGTFQMKTKNNTGEGVVVRLAASTLEQAGKSED